MDWIKSSAKTCPIIVKIINTVKDFKRIEYNGIGFLLKNIIAMQNVNSPICKIILFIFLLFLGIKDNYYTIQIESKKFIYFRFWGNLDKFNVEY